MLVTARLTDTVPGNGIPMSYAYYHKVIKGTAPKSAPTYSGDDACDTPDAGRKRYRCEVCNYEVDMDGDLPADFVCPVCGVDASYFKQVE